MTAPFPIDTGMMPSRRMRLIRQSEVTECGLACLAMVANRWGYDLDLPALRRRFGVSSRGITLRTMMQSADALGLSPRALKIAPGAGVLAGLSGLQTPAILHWDLDHFVVVEKVEKKRAYILDPAIGAGWYDEASLSKRVTGVALELRPSANFQPEKDRAPLAMRQLWSGSSGFRRSLLQVALLSFVLQAHVLASPYFLQLAVDQALPSFDADLLTVLALGFGLFAVISSVAYLLRSFVLLSSGTSLSFGISSNVARRLLRLPIGWFEKRTVGDILSRFQSVQPIQRFLTDTAAATLIDGLLALLTLILMVVYSPLLTLIPVTALLAYAGVRWLFFSSERSAANQRIVAQGREQSTMIESLRGIVTLRLAGRETMRHAAWQNKLSESLGSAYAYDRIRAWQMSAGNLISSIEIVAVVWLAVSGAIAGGFTTGMIFAFLAYRLQFSTATRSLIDQSVAYKMLGLHLDRLSDIALQDEDPGFAEPDAPIEFKGGVCLKGVTYRYGVNDPFVLRGINLEIDPGEHVAITGASGGGKTTLTKILLGLIEPTDGQVLIDGIPLARYGRRSFREQVGAVLQDDVLFAGTIAENVSAFDVLDTERMWEALRGAAIADDVRAMPMKHLTLVGDMGSSLSGGQRQRILLARALYRKPRLLVMDEGTAHLDMEHEKAVNAAISAMGITRIVIAHRKETIEAADRVVVVGDGVMKAV
ncbi:peptidase domain-containing ABC transporter [Sphingomonas sp. 3-13AW]|uniref:peptidase domain-containing ABC transporter n=1 Tax=Sphingomonas sp. 3-13AW TaxID=3050450 RepID=UPI003BB69AF4